MKNIRLLVCRNLQEWCGGWACFAQINESGESLTLPLFKQHQFVEKKIRQFGQAHNVSIGSVKFQEFFRYNATERLSLKFSEISSQFEGLDHRNKSVFMFLNSLFNSTNDSLCYKYKSSCPQTINETLSLYETIGQKVTPKDDLVIVIGEAGMIGGNIFSILSHRKVIIAENIEDIEKNLLKLQPSTVTFALDNDIFTLNNSQRIMDFTTQNSIPPGFLYCYDIEIAIWFAIKIRLFKNFWLPPNTQKIIDFNATNSHSNHNGKLYFTNYNDSNDIDMYTTLSSKHEMLAFCTHSNGMDTFAGGKYILCSKKATEGLKTKGLRVLPCFYGARCRHRRGCEANNQNKSVRISEDILFCNTLLKATCWGLTLVNSPFEQLFSHSHLLLCSEKTNSCVFTDRICICSSKDLLFFYFLYNKGKDLGTIINKQNNFHAMLYKENGPFILMGDPKSTFTGRAFEEVLEYEWKKLSHNKFRIMFTLQNIPKIKKNGLSLNLNKIDELNNLNQQPLFIFSYLKFMNSSNHLLVDGVMEYTGEETLLFMAITGEDITTSVNVELFIHIGLNPYLSISYSFENVLSNLPFWTMFLQYNAETDLGKDESLQKQAEDIVIQFPVLLYKLQIASGSFSNVLPNCIVSSEYFKIHIKESVDLLRSLHQTMIKFVTSFSSIIGPMRLTLKWMPLYVRATIDSIWGKCKYCNCIIYVKCYISACGNKNTRKVLNCKSCGMIIDITNVNIDSFIIGDLYLKRGTSTIQKVNFQNDHSYVMFVDAIMFLDDLSGHRCSLSSIVSLHIKPGCKKQLEFNLEVPLPYEPGRYSLSCYIFANAGLNQLHKFVYLQ